MRDGRLRIQDCLHSIDEIGIRKSLRGAHCRVGAEPLRIRGVRQESFECAPESIYILFRHKQSGVLVFEPVGNPPDVERHDGSAAAHRFGAYEAEGFRGPCRNHDNPGAIVVVDELRRRDPTVEHDPLLEPKLLTQPFQRSHRFAGSHDTQMKRHADLVQGPEEQIHALSPQQTADEEDLRRLGHWNNWMVLTIEGWRRHVDSHRVKSIGLKPLLHILADCDDPVQPLIASNFIKAA